VAEGDGGKAAGYRGDGAEKLVGRTVGRLLVGGVSGGHGADDYRFEGVVFCGCRGVGAVMGTGGKLEKVFSDGVAGEAVILIGVVLKQDR
jgi:hypothetical protein